MAKITVGIPQGTRDFGPETVRKRNYIFNIIRSVFESYGFEPLETPAMENLDTLMGKYGDEGDKLVFKILNNGALVEEVQTEADARKFFIEHKDAIAYYANNNQEVIERARQLTGRSDINISTDNEKIEELKEFGQWLLKKYVKDTYLTKRALRYDLTIPFARYVAMNINKLTLPFKRYQIQPVWRADRPQRGRYREFYQCDADVVGSVDLVTELELLKIYDDVFTKLKLPQIEVRINSRTVLKALAMCIDAEDRLIEITSEIDKLDKVGIEKVKEALQGRGFNNFQIDFIDKFLNIVGVDDLERISNAYELFISTGKFSIREAYAQIFGRLRSLIQYSKFQGTTLKVDFTLARGLNYYTGLIVEVKCSAVKMGSIGGGGTYHNLTGLFGVPDLPGVGISFGVDRIFDVIQELGLFPENLEKSSTVLFFNLGSDPETDTNIGFNEALKALEIAGKLRIKGVSCEIYPKSQTKLEKQFKYAEKKNIPYVVIIGSVELRLNSCKLKNTQTREERTITFEELLNTNF